MRNFTVIEQTIKVSMSPPQTGFFRLPVCPPEIIFIAISQERVDLNGFAT